MLLLLTGSEDGTADRIVRESKLPLFRFNLDLFSDYNIEISPGRWRITNPTGRSIDSENASRVFWWKAFSYGLDQDAFLHEELKYIFRELYSWFGDRHLLIGNPPDLESRIGKLKQLEIARNYFKTAVTQLRVNSPFQTETERKYIVKSLTSGLTTSSKAMYTQEVDPSDLDPKLLWYVQEKITSSKDVTVLVAGSDFFAYSRSREDLEGLDWRKDQFVRKVPWLDYELSLQQTASIQSFLKALGVEWGRIDFMEVDNDLYFLEINLNGQWAFLDLENKKGVISQVVNYIETGKTHGY